MKQESRVAHGAQRGFQELAARSPRLAGFLAFVFGAAMLGVNVLDITYRGRFHAAFFVLGVPLSLLGLWMAITGRTGGGEVKQPRWWRISMFSLLGLGAAVGLYLSIALER